MIRKLFLSDRLYVANVGATFMSQLFSALSVLFLTTKLLSALGNEQFALYGLILNAVVFGGIMDLGMNIGMLRRMIHEKEKTNKLFTSLLVTYLAFFVLLCFLALVVQAVFPAIFSGMSSGHVYVLILLIIQNIIAALLDVMIQSSQKIFKAKIIRIIKTVVEFAAILYSLGSGSLNTILMIMVLVNFLYIAALFVYARYEVGFNLKLKDFNIKTITSHAQYSFWYFLTTLSGVLVFNSQVFIIDRFSSPALLAQFIVFTRFFDIIRTSVSNFTVVLFPAIVTNERDESKAKLLSMFKSAMFRTAFILMMLFGVLFVLGEDIFSYWTKGYFVFDNKLFYFFLIYFMLILVDNVSALFLSALKLNRLTTIVSIIQGLLVLVLTTLTVGQYGLIGVVLSSILALCMTSLLFNPIYLIKKLKSNTVG
jgi:O-antigen/teichoic acid export membrane protein